MHAYMKGNVCVLTFTSAVVSGREGQTGGTGALGGGRVDTAVATVESCSQTHISLDLCVQQTLDG